MIIPNSFVLVQRFDPVFFIWSSFLYLESRLFCPCRRSIRPPPPLLRPQRAARLFPSSARRKFQSTDLWARACGSLSGEASMTSQTLWPCILAGRRSCWQQGGPSNLFGRCMPFTTRSMCWKSFPSTRLVLPVLPKNNKIVWENNFCKDKKCKIGLKKTQLNRIIV